MDNDRLVTALDALFVGNETDQQAGVLLFDYFDDHQSNPANVISVEVLVAWCEEAPEKRCPFAASFITFAHRPETNGPLIWTDQARALIAGTPEPRTVLETLITRFRPMSWSGSRAAVIEANARLLDSLDSPVLSDLMPFVTEAKAQLATVIAQERQLETERDRRRDERFE